MRWIKIVLLFAFFSSLGVSLKHAGWNVHARGPGAHGAVLADYNNDGLIDIYITSNWYGTGPRNFNQFFIQKAPGVFSERAHELGLDMRDAQTHDAVWLDYDQDGDLDLFVGATDGVHRLFEQTPEGFKDVSAYAHIQTRRNTGARAVLAGDVNGDGYTDIFVHNTGNVVDPSPNQLFINQGDGTFVDEASLRGVADPRLVPNPEYGVGQGGTMVDIDNDGDLDILTCVRQMNLRLFINNGKGYFKESAFQKGIWLEEGCDGVTVADLNHDGLFDIITTRATMGTFVRIFYQKPNGTFRDVTQETQLLGEAFSAAVVDMNGDGFEDIVIPDHANLTLRIYLNDHGHGWTLASTTPKIFNDPRALSVADFDNDGDEDILVVHKRGDHLIFQNESRGHWVKLHFVQGPFIHDLYGTHITLLKGSTIISSFQITSGYAYLSHRPPADVILGIPSHEPLKARIQFPGHDAFEQIVQPDTENVILISRMIENNRPPLTKRHGCISSEKCLP